MYKMLMVVAVLIMASMLGIKPQMLWETGTRRFDGFVSDIKALTGVLTGDNAAGQVQDAYAKGLASVHAQNPVDDPDGLNRDLREARQELMAQKAAALAKRSGLALPENQSDMVQQVQRHAVRSGMAD